jgi:hypothetical protein
VSRLTAGLPDRLSGKRIGIVNINHGLI